MRMTEMRIDMNKALDSSIIDGYVCFLSQRLCNNNEDQSIDEQNNVRINFHLLL